ncbi:MULTISPECIES: AAA family ATPase [Pseudomonas]|uniref:ATP-binding protein n=1 Tax=Pseudomonas TaxID=286 RepID=UPI001571AEED|nr:MULTISPECIES: AAA family ATPase [Pseudomonas]MBG6127884.1 magnesium chelatase subunit I [Pseudomonas sp. M2]NSX18948.1 AAA family ATPase [Pseudomonas putida]HDS1743770.1 AAA family ATPase [Pseudomonas putida]
MSEPVQFPLAAVVGADDLKLALCLTAIDPKIGGVLIEGPRGMAKSTLARGLADLLGEGPFVTLPLGASEERLVGTLDLDAALGQGKAQFSPGVLAQADGGVLYVDEVNLLPDTLVDLLLDVAASGTNRIERDGISHRHSARFVLIGTMNPEEGELRPQLLDRFGLNVVLDGLPAPQARQQIIRRRLAFDTDPLAFCEQWAAAQAQLRERCHAARQGLAAIALDDQALAWITERCFAAGVDGLRADLVWLRAARAHCAWRGGEAIEELDVDAVAEFALRHRRRVPPEVAPPSNPPEAGGRDGHSQGGQGDWGALPAQPMASGARREVPNWAKKP